MIVTKEFEGIEFMHLIGHVIHNDIHLDNILLTPSGNVVLHDFGKLERIEGEIGINMSSNMITHYKTSLYYLSNPNQIIPDQIQQWAYNNL